MLRHGTVQRAGTEGRQVFRPQPLVNGGNAEVIPKLRLNAVDQVEHGLRSYGGAALCCFVLG